MLPVADRQGGAALYMVPLNESGLMEQKLREERDEPNPTTIGWAGALTLVVDDVVKEEEGGECGVPSREILGTLSSLPDSG